MGCTRIGQVAPIQLPLFSDLGKTVVVEHKLGKESILYESLGASYPDAISLDDERVAQQAMTANQGQVGSTSHNQKLGGLTIVPVNTLTGNGYTCRNYFIRYIFIGGVGMYKVKAKGQACLTGKLWLVDSKTVSR